jgi:hypothetical protein
MGEPNPDKDERQDQSCDEQAEQPDFDKPPWPELRRLFGYE